MAQEGRSSEKNAPVNGGGTESGNKQSGTGKRSSGNDDATMLDQAKDTGRTLLDQAKTAASEKASSLVADKRAELAGGLTGAVDTVRRIGEVIGEGEQANAVTQYAAEYTEKAAAKLESAADYLASADIRQAARDLESFARRNPLVFIGGAFTLGILAARFLKSTPPSIAAAGKRAKLPAGSVASRAATAGS